jgi:hypothetical protein
VQPCPRRNEEVEMAVLGWFEGRGISKSNPEDTVCRNRNCLLVGKREKIRKLSAPD